MMAVTVPTIDIVDRPQSHGYDGAIDNVLIRLAASRQTPIEDMTAEASPQRIDTSEGAEDIRDEVGRRYSRSNLSGGAGLDFLHSPRRPQDAATRFWDSQGVDVFGTDRGDIYDARLMHRMDAESISTDVIDVCQIDGSVYYARAAGIYELGVGPIKEALTGIIKMVAMGNSLYTLDAVNGVQRYDPPTWTPVVISAVTTYTDMWAVKSRIVAIAANILSDATDDSAILTVPAFDTISDVIEAGPALLAFASTGTIHSLALDQSLSLVPAGESKFGDEIPVMAAETFGVLGIVTAEVTEAGGRVTRFYTAALSLSGSYDVTDLQLIYQIGDRDTTANLVPEAMLATRDSIYTAVLEEGTSTVTLWRYYLPTGGYARAHSVAASGVSSMVEVDDRMFVCVPGSDLYKEVDEYVTSGYVIGPLADFHTADAKQWVGADLSGVALPPGSGLELYDTTDPALINNEASTSWQLVTQLYDGTTESKIATLAGRSSRYHAAKIILRSDSSRLLSPGAQSYSFRALPNPDRDILIRVPINVSDQIESPGRKAVSIPGRGKAMEQALRAYEGQHVLIELYRPALQVRGLIEKFESTIDIIPTFGSVRRVMYARIRGTRLEDSEAIIIETSGASLGQDIAGLFKAGIGVPTA